MHDSTLAAPAHSDTLAFSDISARIALGIHTSEAELGTWLPKGWQVSRVNAGPSKGANIFVGFVDRMLHLDPMGHPIGSGVDRFVGLVALAKPPGATEPVNVVVRIYHNAGMLPGAYKNSRAASITRAYTAEGRDTNPRTGSENWDVVLESGGAISLRLGYQGGTPVTSKQEQRYYSAVEPTFYRIYRFEQVGDMVRSRMAAVDRLQNFVFDVTVPELSHLFDGSHQVTSVAIVPSNHRQVFLPR